MTGYIKLLSIIILFIIFLYYTIKANVKHGYSLIDSVKTNVLSIYIISLVIPLQYAIVEFHLSKQSASFGEIIFLGLWHLLIAAMILFSSKKTLIKSGNSLKWLGAIVTLGVASYFNPNNCNPPATLIGIYYTCSLLISSFVIYRTYNSTELYEAMWNGFKIIVLIEFILAITYPVLGMHETTTMFYGAITGEHAERGFRSSAVGTFDHPGPLGLILSFIFIFYATNFTQGNRKKESFFFAIVSAIVVALSQSRASYIISVLALLIIYVLRNVTKIKNIIRYSFIGTLSILFISYIFIFHTDIGNNLFLSYEFNKMLMARFVHWYIGWNAFIKNPIFGTGLNAHLSFISDNKIFRLLGSKMSQNDFYATNPIHNSHLIILCELGLLGGILWIWGLYSLIKINIGSIIKLNRNKMEYPTSHENIYAVSQSFAVLIIIAYIVYAFIGWATMHYYTFVFVLLAVFFSEKGRLEREMSTPQKHYQ